MKKFFSLLTLAAILPLGFTNTTIQSTYAVNDFSNLPETCEPGAYFVNAWHDTVRSRRISDRATLVVDKPGWGRRGYVKGRTFDLKSFNIEIDVSQVLPGTCINLILGAEKTYSSEPTMMINMDILRSRNEDDLFFVTCSTTPNGHQISIPNFTNGPWAEDGAFTGVNVTTKEKLVSIELKYIDDTNSRVTVNETPFTVETNDLYGRCEGKYDHSLAIGMFNNDNADVPYVIEKVGDASDEIYFGETGDYTVTKKSIEELKTVDLANLDNVVAAKQKLDAIPWNKLYSFDQEYLNNDYAKVSKAVNDAFAKLDNSVVVPIFAEKVNELANANKTLTNDEEIANAEKAAKAVEDAKKIVNVATLEGDLKTTYETALATYETELAKIPEAGKTLLENAVVAYENGVKTVSNVEQLANISVLKKNIPTHYYKYLTEEEISAYDARIAAAETLFNEQTLIDHKNWKQGSNGHVVKNDNGEVTLSSCGESLDKTVEEGNGIFNSEKISALDFEMTLRLDKLPNRVGSWFSFGIMEKPEMWLNVETPDVQNNKGVFFLINRTSESKLMVQSFICSLTSNRFFDSKLNQQIDVPCKDGEDLVVKMFVETKEIAGVTDEVYTTSFNGVTFDQENVSARKIKTALGKSCEGHFILATSGFDSADPALITIKDINKNNALDETLVPQVDLTPTSKDAEKTFINGSEAGIVTFNIDTKGQDLTSVKVDGKEIAKENYIYDAVKGKLTLTNAYLNTLEVKDHTVVAATKGGEVIWVLHVNANPDTPVDPDKPVDPDTPDTPDTPEESPLNIGALVGGIVGGVIALGAIIFGIIFAIKRKKAVK